MSNKKLYLLSRPFKNQKGISAIMVAIVLPVLLGFTALAIDVGYMYATKNELQNIADAAALAGAGELGRIYKKMSYVDQQSYDIASDDGDLDGAIDSNQIKILVDSVATKNNAAGKAIGIDTDNDVIFGTWDLKELDPSAALTVTPATPDAVRVTARRDANKNNPVTTFFARIFSIFGGTHDTFEASAQATAALSGIGYVDPGVLKAPFGISENHSCGPGTLKLSPTQTSCMGWHNFFDAMNANNLASKMIGLIRDFGPIGNDGITEGEAWLKTHFKDFYEINNFDKFYPPETAPETFVGQPIEMQGGEISSLLNGDYYKIWDSIDEPKDPSKEQNMTGPNPFLTLYDFFRFRDGDGSGTETVDFCPDPYEQNPVLFLADEVWTTTVPIYVESGDGCDNPNNATERTIVGYAKVKIRVPDRDSPENLELCFDCNTIIEPGRGSGSTIGNVIGSIPNLVQ